eukprot:360127-Chlamydomonas_euryale.AAC.4
MASIRPYAWLAQCCKAPACAGRATCIRRKALPLLLTAPGTMYPCAWRAQCFLGRSDRERAAERCY